MAKGTSAETITFPEAEEKTKPEKVKDVEEARPDQIWLSSGEPIISYAPEKAVKGQVPPLIKFVLLKDAGVETPFSARGAYVLSLKAVAAMPDKEMPYDEAQKKAFVEYKYDKIQRAFETSPLFREGTIYREKDRRCERWKRECATEKAERIAALLLNAQLTGKSLEAIQEDADKRMRLNFEIVKENAELLEARENKVG